MRPIDAPDEELRRSLVEALGASVFEAAHGQGERSSVSQAVRYAAAPSAKG
jgi:hypothetical protein